MRLDELEGIVAAAWPAAEQRSLAGWLLRATGGPSKRANSVAALGDDGGQLGARLQEVEGWYAARGLPAAFQIGPVSLPEGLDEVLSARGYGRRGDALCSTAESSSVARLPTSMRASITSIEPSEEWLDLVLSQSRFSGAPEALLGTLARLGERCCFASAHDEDDRPCAVGLGVRSEHSVGVYCMFTKASHRRRGAALAVLVALAERAVSEGRNQLYLLVERDNLVARGLYAKCGFTDRYAYHFRVQPPPVITDGLRGNDEGRL